MSRKSPQRGRSIFCKRHTKNNSVSAFCISITLVFDEIVWYNNLIILRLKDDVSLFYEEVSECILLC